MVVKRVFFCRHSTFFGEYVCQPADVKACFEVKNRNMRHDNVFLHPATGGWTFHFGRDDASLGVLFGCFLGSQRSLAVSLGRFGRGRGTYRLSRGRLLAWDHTKERSF